ncbi:MarR family transcriptional regulator [Nocardioides aromaticivorans]|uniref:MarR family transcriptional regulator n=1 Tax=Nocardioides aromaticivorans TaxID=200618 RepID=A0ABX7PRV6_9ACTN|nr:MarR family transcriptional regulator [Nocardioides aromaticivorans]QSR28745.1 MarR family transcriptional regulator [Nocardioides aromaticivorans]
MARTQPGPGDRPWHATATLETLRSLLEAGARIRHEVSRRAQLSDVELATLERLSHGPIGPAELARHLDVTSAAATGIVDRLSRRGHLERVPHEDDRRRTQLHITDSATAEVSRHLRPMFEGLARLDGEFSDEERAVVERYLRGALAAVEAAIAEPGDGPSD